MLCCPSSYRHADIPESSICYTGALLDSVIKIGKEVELLPKCRECFLVSGKGSMGRAVGRSSLLRGPEVLPRVLVCTTSASSKDTLWSHCALAAPFHLPHPSGHWPGSPLPSSCRSTWETQEKDLSCLGAKS